MLNIVCGRMIVLNLPTAREVTTSSSSVSDDVAIRSTGFAGSVGSSVSAIG